MNLIRIAILVILIIALFGSNLNFIKEKILSSANVQSEISKLELENDSLKAQIFINENLSGKEIRENTWDYFNTKVFSNYPFNNQSLIAINAGINDGLAVNQVVVSAANILLGQIIKINQNASLVRTIFDNNFNIAVKIGDNKVNALLRGGLPPTLEMIEKNKNIKNGDIVYNADQNFPYGFKLGEIQIINSENAAEPFKKAFLKTDYSIGSLEDVFVIKNFEVLNK